MNFSKEEIKDVFDKICIENNEIKSFLYNKIDSNLKISILDIENVLNAIPILQQQYLIEHTTNDMYVINMLDIKIRDILNESTVTDINYLLDSNVFKYLLNTNNVEMKQYFENIIKISFITNNRTKVLNYVNEIKNDIDYEYIINLLTLLNHISKIKQWSYFDEDEILC